MDATPQNATPQNAKPQFEDKSIENVPGHWLLARLGKRVLRPGGLALTQEALSHAHIPGKQVVELACGIGRTAQEIMAQKPSYYTGIDANADSVAIVSNLVGDKGTCKQAMAEDTGLEAESCDVCVCEAMLTMQTPEHKAQILREVARILRPGGYFVSHELGLCPDTLDENKAVEIKADVSRAIRVNAKPLRASEWKQLLEGAGLDVVWTNSAPMDLLNPQRTIADEGICGAIHIMRNVLTIPGARKRVMEMRSVFTRHHDNLAGIAFVAQKRR